MPTIFRTNNPTKVIRIDKSAISLRVIKHDDMRTFHVDKLDRTVIQLPSDVRVACLAIAGQNVQYFELGTLSDVDFRSYALSEIGDSAALRFRVMFYDAISARIVGCAENIRSADEDGPTPSLLSIQPADLGGPLWKLELPEDSGESQPTLLVEQKVFPVAKSVATDRTFLAYVLPEVVRQIAASVARLDADPESDESWIVSWDRFLRSINSTERTDGEDHHLEWIDNCVKAFCRRGQMLSILEKQMFAEEGNAK